MGAETKEMIFGGGKILISPFELGIAFSTQQGSGKVNEKHPTIKKGDVLNESKQDLIFRFMNKESLEVLKWACENGCPSGHYTCSYAALN